MTVPDTPIPVAILGATGTVGRRLVDRVAAHPWFRLVEVAGSDRSVGRTLQETRDACEHLDERIRALRLTAPTGPFEASLILSALPRAAAEDLEPRLVAAGKLVVSNASAGRMRPGVPLVIPEVNPDHLALISAPGVPSPGLVTNPNCAVVPLAMALAPLHRAFGVSSVVATTMQAVSGAGLPGPGSITMIDNLIPRIDGEEEKISTEPQKILGKLAAGDVESADFSVSASSTRVPVLHGHLVDVSVRLAEPVPLARALEAMRGWKGEVHELQLPSLPEYPLRITHDPDRPQPRLDRDLGEGMTVTVGRLRECRALDLRFTVLAHNLERGAAGAAIANAELVVRTGRVPG